MYGQTLMSDLMKLLEKVGTYSSFIVLVESLIPDVNIAENIVILLFLLFARIF